LSFAQLKDYLKSICDVFDMSLLKIGLYAKPGTIVNVQFPAEAVNKLVVSV
jgi:hypothetical protein